MNPNDAISLAVLISQTWPRNQIPVDVWEETLTPLDGPRCEQAYRDLRNTIKYPPSISDFMAKYHGLLGTAREANLCEHCAGTGIVTDTNHPHHWPGRPDTMPPANDDGTCNCNCATWCPNCPEGTTRRSMLQRMNGQTSTTAHDNDRTRAA